MLVPTLPKERNSHPRHPYKRSHNTIRRFLPSSTPRQRQSQPSVNESKRKNHARSPHVDVADDGSALVLAERHVLQHAAEGDEPDGGEEEETEDGVGCVELGGC
jgi:hypothetical protein